MEEEERSIYKIARRIKRKEHSLFNALRSIYEDAGFVSEIRGLRPTLPLVANLRCGLWYARRFDESCYFKSTDGHTGNWGFSATRLNIHVASLAAERGGCMIVDSTRKGKRFPDSMSKTIPIWTCVLNRGIASLLDRDRREGWDCELHLPRWVSETEKSSIRDRLDQWVRVLLETTSELSRVAASLKKPLRPLWISQQSLIWINDVPDVSSLDFTPVILISASRPLETVTHHRFSSETGSWTYIPGAADDEESWARGLTPRAFWSNAGDIIDAGPEECNRMVAEIVRQGNRISSLCGDIQSSQKNFTIQWIGDTGLAVGPASALQLQHESLQATRNVSVIDCTGGPDSRLLGRNCFLSLCIEDSKVERNSLRCHLSSAVEFSAKNLEQGRSVLIFCKDGEDISVAVCIAVLECLFSFSKDGGFSSLISNGEIKELSKRDVRQGLVYLCKYAPNARPSRSSLKQVYNFLLDRYTVTTGCRRSCKGDI